MTFWTKTAFASILLATSCTPSVGDGNEEPDAPAPPPASPPTSHRVFLLSDGDAVVPIHDARILAGDGTLLTSLQAGGCASLADVVASAGPGGGPAYVTLETGAAVPASLLEAFARAIDDGATAAASGVRVAVGDVKGDGAPRLTCVVPVAETRIKEARLEVRKSGDGPAGAKVVWKLAPGRPLVVEPAPERPAGAMLDLDAPVPPATAALLLPAVQKVREAAMSTPNDERIVIFNVDAPPLPFDVHAPTDSTEESTAALGSTSGLVHVHGGGTGFAVKYRIDTTRISPEVLRVAPGMPLGLVRPDLPASGAPSIDLLRASAASTPATTGLSRLLAALDDQPSLSADPSVAKSALEAYWTATPGMLPSFSNGLAAFLGRAADEEGLWAYTRLVTAYRVFEHLDTSEGRRPDGLTVDDILVSRLLVAAASAESKAASFAMLPGALLVAPERTGHDYRLGLSAVQRLADAGPSLVSAPPHQLVGIEPDEIDVAVAAAKEGAPEVRTVDVAAKRYLAKRDEVLAAAAPTAAQLDELAAATTLLRDALAQLGAATEVRFAATR